MFKFNKSSGQVSRLLLVLAVVVLVAVIITYLVMKMAEAPTPPVEPVTEEIPLPDYEETLDNIEFIFESAIDRGDTLRVSEIINKNYTSANQKDLKISNSGARYIQVTIGAKNIGTLNTDKGSWDIENIVDSEGRNFVPVNDYTIQPWLTNNDTCGALLKPAFDPTPCTKIYEVSKESTELKVRVRTGVNNTAQNFSSGKIKEYLIDLIVK